MCIIFKVKVGKPSIILSYLEILGSNFLIGTNIKISSSHISFKKNS